MNFRGAVVSTVKHTASGIEVEIRLQKKDLLFFAKYAGETFTDTDGEKLKRRVWAYIEETYGLEWIPVIEVLETRPFCQATWEQADYLGIAIERFYYAYTQDGWLRKLAWTAMERMEDLTGVGGVAKDPRKEPGNAWIWRTGNNRRFEPPCEWNANAASRDARRIYYLPYSIEVWTGLLALIETLQIAKQKLREIVGATDLGMERLAAVGASILKMLPAGEEDD